MLNDKIKRYYSKIKRQRIHKYATFFMFIMLAVESLITYADAFYYQGDLVFRIHLDPFKIAATVIYISVAVLIGMKVRYKLLLIPDFFLLILKLCTAVKSILSLSEASELSFFAAHNSDLLESAVESLLFSLFLITLFIGKLSHPSDKIREKIPFVCLGVLAACFPFTLAFEIIKAVGEALSTDSTTALLLFNFTRGIMNEAFLDLPYALLILLVFFIPERKRASSQTKAAPDYAEQA